MTRAKHEKPQSPNLHQLTIDQHIFPRRGMERFADSSGRVCLRDMLRAKTRMAKVGDSIFVAKRAWDHRAEAGYMKAIEDEFQSLAASVVEDRLSEIDEVGKGIVDRFWKLWQLRSIRRVLPAQELQMKGVTGGGLSREQEEALEKKGVAFLRFDGKMPARMINGIQIQVLIDKLSYNIERWAVIRAERGEFLVPDVPRYGIIPLSPSLCLVANQLSGVIRQQNVAEINESVKSACQAYFFARDLSACP